MKVKNSRKQEQPPEDCGVWLDTAELKRRPQQMVLPYASNRFNPILRKKSLDCFLFDFTQTKSPQTCTKQTSMYSFFSPSGKKKMSQTKDKNEDANVSESLSQMGTAVPTCRCRNPDDAVRNEHTLHYYQHWTSEGSPVHRKNLCKEDRKSSDSVSFLMDVEKQTLSEQDKNLVLEKANTAQISLSAKRSFFKVHEDLEDIRIFSMSSLKSCTNSDSHFLSSFPSSEEDSDRPQDDLSQSVHTSQLFTEDSEGNRVINHRPVCEKKRKCHSGIPLQDKTNLTWDTSSPPSVCQLLSQENSMPIFTQDSEGNVVIKH